MNLEFSRAKAEKARALERPRGAEEELAADLPDLKTFQQVVWRLEKDALLRGEHFDYKDADGYDVHVADLVDDVEHMDLEEENGDLGFREEVRRLPPLMKKLMALRSTRMEINAMYAREWPTKLTPEGEGFNVHVIDRNAVKSLRQPEDTTPIIIAPGYTVGPRAVRRNAVSLAELGRSVMTYAVPTNSDSFDENEHFPDGTPVYSKVHATALLRAMEVGQRAISSNPEQYDVIGYSFGAVASLIAAAAEPQKFRNIVLINPAGLTHNAHPDTLERVKRFIPAGVVDEIYEKARYAARFRSLAWDSKKHAKQVLAETGEQTWAERLPTPGNIARALSELGELDLSLNKSAGLHEEFSAEMRKIGKAGGLKEALRIADAIGWADLLPIIESLQHQGVGVAILPGEDDPLFNVNGIERAGKMTGTDTFPIAGGHAHMGFYPGVVSELCIDTFEHLKEER